MTLKISLIKDRTTQLCYFIILYTLFIGFFTLNFNAPNSVLYLTDIINIILVLAVSPRLYKAISKCNLKVAFVFILILIVAGTFSAVLNGFHLFQWIWALRNWGRFFTFFTACICVLKQKSIDKLIKFFKIFFHINFVVIVLQYIILGITGDSANGLIGRNTSSVNLLFTLIVTVIAIAEFKTKKIKWYKFIALLIEISIINIIAELKANFVFMVILFVGIYLLDSKLTAKDLLRIIVIMILSISAAYVGMRILVIYYPNFEKILTYSGFMEIINSKDGYGNSGFYDRLNGISVTNTYFFKSNTWLRLFGYGIGNTEYSSFDFLKSSFFIQYGNSFRYLNFTMPVIYLECGLVGIITFFAFHISLLKRLARELRCKKHIDSYYVILGLGTLIVVTIFIIYNNLHRTDVSFLMAFMCSVPFALLYRSEGKKHGKN